MASGANSWVAAVNPTTFAVTRVEPELAGNGIRRDRRSGSLRWSR